MDGDDSVEMSSDIDESVQPSTSANDEAAGVHDPLSEMHCAIERQDFGQMLSLLDSGDHFCTGMGYNCFMLAAQSPKIEPSQRWILLEKMLEIDSTGVNARFIGGTPLLMHFLNDKEKLKRLCEFGADLNAVDCKGKSVLLKTLLTGKFALITPLLDLGADPMKHSFLNQMFCVAMKFEAYLKPCAALMTKILDEKYVTEEALATLPVHPIFYLFSMNRRDSKLNTASYFLLKKGFIKRRDMLLKRNISQAPTNAEWTQAKQLLGIRDVFKFCPLGHFLFTIQVWRFGEPEVRALSIACFNKLVEIGFVPVNQERVLHPILALLYNIFQCSHLNKESDAAYFKCTAFLAHFVFHCMEKLKDYPIPHKVLTTGKYRGCLDLLVLFTPLMATTYEGVFKILFALLQLSPVRPLNNIAFLVSLTLTLNKRRPANQKLIYREVALKLKDLCPIRENIGADSFATSELCQTYNFSFSACPEKIKSMSTLKMFCIWRVREILMQARSNDKDTLPSIVRNLCASGLIPVDLQPDLLVYKKNPTGLNF